MTAYCFVGSPGFSNWTCILGALPLGTASDGETYSLAISCEYPVMLVTPINARRNKVLVIVFPSLNGLHEMCRMLPGPVCKCTPLSNPHKVRKLHIFRGMSCLGGWGRP